MISIYAVAAGTHGPRHADHLDRCRCGWTSPAMPSPFEMVQSMLTHLKNSPWEPTMCRYYLIETIGPHNLAMRTTPYLVGWENSILSGELYGYPIDVERIDRCGTCGMPTIDQLAIDDTPQCRSCYGKILTTSRPTKQTWSPCKRCFRRVDPVLAEMTHETFGEVLCPVHYTFAKEGREDDPEAALRALLVVPGYALK